jgi:hypothetical protein
LYGEFEIAKLGNNELDIGVSTRENNIDFSQVSEADGSNAVEGEAPDEIAVQADNYENKELLAEAKQAAEYSQRIKNLG